MSESARDLLVRGVAAAKAGDSKEARFFLEWMLRNEPTADQRTEACLWLSDLSQEPSEKRRWLEEVLALRPVDSRARRKFALLTGDLRPDEVVNPEALPAPTEDTAAPETLRVDCPRCGGVLLALAGVPRLGCAYCGAEISVSAAGKRLRASGPSDRLRRRSGDKPASKADPAARNLAVELARLRSHRPPESALHVECRGCGATFLLPAPTISLCCPYCQAAHVVDSRNIVSRMAPDGMLPVQVDRQHAIELLQRWGEENRVDSSRPSLDGIYLPFWSFEITGEIASQEVRKDPRQPGADVLIDIGRMLTTLHPIDNFFLGDLGRGDSPMDRLPLRLSLCVPATRRQPALLAEVARATASTPAAAFDPILLAGWLAETYQLPLSQAAIEARGEAVQRARREDGGWFRGRESYDTSGLIVEDFKLLLIPLWIGGLQVKSGASPVWLHGVTGQVFAGLG